MMAGGAKQRSDHLSYETRMDEVTRKKIRGVHFQSVVSFASMFRPDRPLLSGDIYLSWWKYGEGTHYLPSGWGIGVWGTDFGFNEETAR